MLYSLFIKVLNTMNIKAIIFMLILALQNITSIVVAQNREKDSLLLILKTQKDDTNKVNTLAHLCWNLFKTSSYDTAKLIANEGLLLAQKLKFKNGEKKLYSRLGIICDYQGNPYDAITFQQKNIAICKEQGDEYGVAKAYTNLGLIYTNLGNYPEALRYHFMSLQIKEKIKQTKDLDNVYNNMGIVFDYQKNFKEALKYYTLALKIREKKNDIAGLSESYNNLGILYFLDGKIDTALSYQEKSLGLKKTLGDLYGEATCYTNIAAIYHEQKQYDKALNYTLKSKELYEKIGFTEGVANATMDIGTIYIENHKFIKAKQYIIEGLKISKEIGNKQSIITALHHLSLVDSLLGNYKDAYTHYKLEMTYKDSLFNEENIRNSTQTQLQYEFDKKQTADSLLVAEERKITAIQLKQEKTQRYTLYGGLVLVSLFGAFMFNRFKITQKQKIIIEEKEKVTEQQKLLIEEKHKEITDSINYAERIQRSFLATKELLDANLNEYFVFFKPKDVVSGDFYWAATSSIQDSKLKIQNEDTVLNSKTSSSNLFYLATADSTGHGVPGAIMSLLNITSLEKAIETETAPHLILNKTRTIIIDRLKKDGSAEGGKDGMDCSLLVFNKENNVLQIAAANNPVWIVRASTSLSPQKGTGTLSEAEVPQVIEIKPDKMPVGKHDKQDIPFTLHEIQLQKGDVIYTLTDGFPDQFGGEKGKKFMSKNLRELLAANAHLPMHEQKQLLETTFANWKKDVEQVDDVTVIGVRV